MLIAQCAAKYKESWTSIRDMGLFPERSPDQLRQRYKRLNLNSPLPPGPVVAALAAAAASNAAGGAAPATQSGAAAVLAQVAGAPDALAARTVRASLPAAGAYWC
jgi:hypothetical protein